MTNFKKKFKNIFSKSIILFISTLIPLKVGDYYLGVSLNKKIEVKSINIDRLTIRTFKTF